MDHVVSMVALGLSFIASLTGVIVYIITMKGDLRVMSERLIKSEELVEHLIQEGVKFKDKQHLFENTLTKIDSWQGTMGNTITDWRKQSDKEYAILVDGQKAILAKFEQYDANILKFYKDYDLKHKNNETN